MSENLLYAPERGPIESLLLKIVAGIGKTGSYERLLGFISGAAITPGGFDASDWMQPLFDLNGVIVQDVDHIEPLIASLTSLYDRVAAINLRKENLCPFDVSSVEVLQAPLPVLDWATGLHSAVSSQEDIWYPYEDEVEWVPNKLKERVNINIQCLSALAEPSKIPEMIKDPTLFQRNVLSKCGLQRETLRETWDEELLDLFKAYCIGQLDSIMKSLQEYYAAYEEGDVVVIHMDENWSKPS